MAPQTATAQTIADGDQTNMLMSSDFFWDEALAENVEAGWAGMFNKLDFVLLEMECLLELYSGSGLVFQIPS